MSLSMLELISNMKILGLKHVFFTFLFISQRDIIADLVSMPKY